MRRWWEVGREGEREGEGGRRKEGGGGGKEGREKEGGREGGRLFHSDVVL